MRFNTHLGMDGTGQFDASTGQFTESYDEAHDVLAVEVPSGSLQEDVEQFTIALETAEGGTHMVLSWERTEVRIPIAAAGSVEARQRSAPVSCATGPTSEIRPGTD